MKTKRSANNLTTLLALAAATSASAATITQNATPSGAGVPYRWDVGLSGTDTASLIRHVGAWSWEDSTQFASGTDPRGWTHTSDWVRLSLSQDASFTFTLSREANVAWPSAGDPGRTTGASASFFPSFTIYAGTDTDGDQEHIYNNKPGFDLTDTGSLDWATPTYVAHIDNSTLTSVSLTLNLAAGDYTIAVGSNAPANDSTRQGYLASLSTSPVPEPGSLAFLALTGLAALRRRR